MNTIIKTEEQAQISYDVKVISTSEHLFKIKMNIKLAYERDEISLALPAWIPGSYMIRDFAKNLHNIQSENKSLNITQKSKQDWLISSQVALREFSISYFVYAFDLSVRSAFINDEYAFFNGTSLFLCLKGFEDIPHIVHISEFENLEEKVVTGLPLQDQANQQYIAKSYLDLIDHPFLLGQFEDYCFCVNEHKFHLVFTGNNDIDLPRLESDLIPIIEHHFALFGEFPCDEYWFITLLCDSGFGGLEHKNSTVLQYGQSQLPLIGESKEMSTPYQQFLSLCSHELFHTWHVKRIRPVVMTHPNLYEEVYTPQLWIYEGFTSLYDDLSLARAKVISAEQYVQILAETITRLYRTPGRHVQSLTSSSFEAWSKFYKQDAGSINHIVSYYNKGAIVALCLDITLRQLSQDTVSLDHVMQKLWQDYGKLNVGTEDDVIEKICLQHFNIDISSFIHMATESTLELPLLSLLEYIGLSLTFRSTQGLLDKGGKSEILFDKDFGASIVNKQGALYVMSVQHGRAAAISGLQVGDKIIAINQQEAKESNFLRILNQGKLSSTMPLHIIRDGRLLSLQMSIIDAVKDTCDIQINDKTKFENWLIASSTSN